MGHVGRHRNGEDAPAITAASSSAAAKLQAAAGLLRTHKVALLVAAIVAAAAVTGVRVAHTSAPTASQAQAQAATAAKVLVPADGDLHVGAVTVPQMLGACDGSSCYHVPPAVPVQVTMTPAAGQQLQAGVSTLFVVTSAFAEDGTGTQAPFTVTGSQLHADGVHPGSYVVTLTGVPNGGVWQLKVVLA